MKKMCNILTSSSLLLAAGGSDWAPDKETAPPLHSRETAPALYSQETAPPSNSRFQVALYLPSYQVKKMCNELLHLEDPMGRPMEEKGTGRGWMKTLQVPASESVLFCPNPLYHRDD